MKVIAINGSPRKEGNTYTAIKRVCDGLEKEGISTEIINVGSTPFGGCRACGACGKLGKCAFGDKDGLNEIGAKMSEADGIILGSPVYYADINGNMKSFLDRVFYTFGKNFRFKPAATLVALRRGGGAHAYQTLNNYVGICEMIQVPSIYWNDVHGGAPGECVGDEEAMCMMDALAQNMTYLLKMQAESKVAPPEKITKINTNFIR